MDIKTKQGPLVAKRRSSVFYSEKSRVITRFYTPSPEIRTKEVIDRVLRLSDEEVDTLLDHVIREFGDRHRYFRQTLEKHFLKIERYIPEGETLTDERQLLMGSYFTSEYSVEAAAIFNPSIVEDPNQNGVPEGSKKFIMSFRVTGEGHISSIEFRSGRIDEDDNIFFDPVSKYIETPELYTNRKYSRHLFHLKLNEMGACNEVTDCLLNELDEDFTFDEFKEKIDSLDVACDLDENHKNDAKNMALWLAKSNYIIKFHPDHQISERVIFPVSENESRGIEDARFVRFVDDDGSVIYYATYTGYNGFTILPQLIETRDFCTFRIITLNGKAVQNKGMALFPRKINGKYAMISRQDGVNIHLMYSDNIHFWQESSIMQKPLHPWEFVQIGNGGSPIETKAGWLMLTHGVGPMRKYTLGIELLDLNDPSKIIGRLDDPILAPTQQEREGYVPNVVYTCGGIIHNDELIIPYAVADQRTSIATLSVSEVLDRMGHPL
ncbi:MAG: glycosidase [bacterium]|nr:MAG: glycosidase [bacterium]